VDGVVVVADVNVRGVDESNRRAVNAQSLSRCLSSPGVVAKC
jgi:hypothetical protein